MLCCWLGQGVSGVLAASLLVAVGDVFRSGADQALLYQSCAVLDRHHEFQKIEATARTVQLAAMVGLVLAGGAIVERWGFGAGWFVETALCAVGLIIACAMVEPPARGDESESEAAATPQAADSTPRAVLLGAARVDHAGRAAWWRGDSRGLLGADDR